MVKIEINKELNKIVVLTDDESVRFLLECRRKSSIYQPWCKKWVYKEVVDKIYEERRIKCVKGIYQFTLGLGWAAYLSGIFKTHVTTEDYNKLVGTVRADSYRDMPFSNLRDYQNTDVLHLLKYKVGLCTVNTGYGKTQVIATLANYAYSDLSKSVLLVAPGKKAKDELVKRCKSIFNLDVPSADGRLDCIITTGLLNNKKFKDPVLLEEEKKRFKKYDWVLVDEVEYTINPGGDLLYSMLTQASVFYGFSGTADKYKGRMINFTNGLDETVAENKNLVKYFGPSLIYRMPLHLDIDNIQIKTLALNSLSFKEDDFKDEGNIYMATMNKIWTNPGICKLIVKIAKSYPMLFIPINNLNYIISDWIDNYFKGIFRILLISGEGYIYWDLQGNRTSLSLIEACEYIKDGKVDIIPSTSSGYRALDFPGLENIFLIQGVVAGVVLQSIGRVARSSHMNIISIAPMFPARIPIYSKGAKDRDEMIQEYYKYCNMTNSIINEDDI